MEIQRGKNPEYIFSVCFNCAWYSGELAVPVKLTWWNTIDALGHRNIDISITLLCWRFGLEIWRWKE